MENRKNAPGRSSPLPLDYLRMVSEVFTTNFDEGLRAFAKIANKPRFEARGDIHLTEIVLCVSLHQEGQLAATSVYASSDYDPRASVPTIEELLAACVDAIATVYQQLLVPGDVKRLEHLADESLSALENVPFEWTPVQVEKFRIHIKADKANPALDEMTEDWLAKNDPQYRKRAEEAEEATKSRFFTGPKNLDEKDLRDDEDKDEEAQDSAPKTPAAARKPPRGTLH
ncbi:MAG: hypothetical protein NDJ89_05805 [Oligoflexia bacterium]|nr:hypothetical protein [Oligoflexia bacterium]